MSVTSPTLGGRTGGQIAAPRIELMRTTTLGRGGPVVSRAGLGLMGMSGIYGQADDQESIATIHAALDAGITLLDTGDFYGMGHNELLLRETTRPVHLAGGGHVSWNAFAKEIFRQAGIDCVVEAVTSAEMARPAPRPAWSALESERRDSEPLPDWREGLAGYLAARLR